MRPDDLWLSIPPINLWNVNSVYSLFSFRFNDAISTRRPEKTMEISQSRGGVWDLHRRTPTLPLLSRVTSK